MYYTIAYQSVGRSWRDWVTAARDLANWLEAYLSPPPGSGSWASMNPVSVRTTHHLSNPPVDARADASAHNNAFEYEGTYWA